MALQHLCSTSAFLATLNMFNILGYHKIQFMIIRFTSEHQKTRIGILLINFFHFDIMGNNESSGFEAANDFDFLPP